MPALTQDEITTLLQSPTIARLATVKPSGVPYIVPIWQHWDGMNIFVIPRAKARFIPYLQAHPPVALSVANDLDPAHNRVLVEGQAHLMEGPAKMQGQMLAIGEEMAFRFNGDAGLDYLQSTLSSLRYLVRIAPERITSWRGAWHPRYQ